MVFGSDTRATLYALCHEMGNLIGAIRLQTHLLDQDMTPRDLAIARSEIDVLGARVSALLALVRPLEEASTRREGEGVDPDGALAVAEHGLETLLVPGVEVVFEPGSGGRRMQMDRIALQALVTSFLHLAVEQVRPSGRVRASVESDGPFLAVVVEDDGPLDAPLVSWRNEPLRGRTLLAALADRIVSPVGGEFEAESSPTGSRVAIRVPDC